MADCDGPRVERHPRDDGACAVLTLESPRRPNVDRTSRAGAAIISGSAFSILTTALGFIATPIILHSLGVQRFGLARALGDIFAYLALLEFGLAGASRGLLATEVANDVTERTASALALTLQAFTRATILKLCGGIALIVLCPYLLRVGEVDSYELRLGAAILAFTMLSTPIGALQALLSAQQREHANNLTAGFQNVAITCSAVAFAWLRWGIPGQMAAQALGTILVCFAVVWLTRETLRAARNRTVTTSDERKKAFVRLNRSTFWRMLAGRLAITSDRVTIGIMLGGSAVTGFHATVRLTDAVFPHLVGIGNGAWPAMVDIHNRGDSGLFAKRLCEVTTTICGVAVAMTAPIVMINQAFVELWLGPGVFAGWILTIACCLNVALIALVSFWEWCFQCTQKVDALIPVTVVSCAANIVTSVLGTWILGASGPALGTAISITLVVIPWDLRLISRHFGVPMTQLFRSIGKPFALGIPYLICCHFVGRHWLATRWLPIAVFATVSCGLWVIIGWFTVFDQETRSGWRGRITRILSKARSG